jgi:hypothetical protein
MIATPSPAVSPSPADSAAAGPPKLLDQVRAAARSRRYGAPTEEIFVGWVRRFILFHDKRHPDQLGETEVARFLSHLAVEDRVSPSIQSQARAAIVFLYRYVLRRPLGPLDGVVRAQRPVSVSVARRSRPGNRQANGAA